MSVRLNSVVKRFGAAVAVDQVDVDIPSGAFFVILGPSGCGKSTLLRLIAGLERLDAGEIRLGETLVSGAGHHAPPETRKVGMVFQSFALWPHMTVQENVAFPIEAAGARRRAAAEAAEAHLKTVALEPFAARKPAELSGGQRQRVALARCLAGDAQVVLMDEPLANLDPHLRAAMEEEIAAFHRRANATTLYITHDQREAMALADKVAIMRDGRFVQVGAPQEIYDRPSSGAAAEFVGRGAQLDAEILSVGAPGAERRAQIRLGAISFEVAAPSSAQRGPARVFFRPEHVRLGAGGRLAGRVVDARYRGGAWEATIAVEGLPAPLAASARRRLTVGEALPVDLADGWILPAD